MFEQLGNTSRLSLTASLLAGLICAGIAPALPQQGPPDFSANNAGWVSVFGEWTPLPGSPPPVKQDPVHHYVPNNVAEQPTFRIADIDNPNLTQFAKDSLKQTNDAVLAEADVVTLGALLGDGPGLSPDPGTTDVLYPNTRAGENPRAAR